MNNEKITINQDGLYQAQRDTVIKSKKYRIEIIKPENLFLSEHLTQNTTKNTGSWGRLIYKHDDDDQYYSPELIMINVSNISLSDITSRDDIEKSIVMKMFLEKEQPKTAKYIEKLDSIANRIAELFSKHPQYLKTCKKLAIAKTPEKIKDLILSPLENFLPLKRFYYSHQNDKNDDESALTGNYSISLKLQTQEKKVKGFTFAPTIFVEDKILITNPLVKYDKMKMRCDVKFSMNYIAIGKNHEIYPRLEAKCARVLSSEKYSEFDAVKYVDDQFDDELFEDEKEEREKYTGDFE